MTARKYLLLLLCSPCFLFCEAQTPTFAWAKAMGGNTGDGCYAIDVDAVGNVYTTGYFTGTADFDPGAGTLNLSSAGGADVFVAKMDAAGDLIWVVAMGGPGDDRAEDIAVDTLGNVHLTGYFNDSADFDPGAGVFKLLSAGGDDVFVAALNPSGGLLWARRMGGAGEDRAEGIATDIALNTCLTGYFSNTADFDPDTGTFILNAAGETDIFVVKLDTGGHLIWADRMGGVAEDKAQDITVDDSGNVYTTGYFKGMADFDPGPAIFNMNILDTSLYGAFVSRLNSSGAFANAFKISGNGYVTGNSLKVNPAQQIYLTGWLLVQADFQPGAGSYIITAQQGFNTGDIYYAKYDINNDLVWVGLLGGVLDEFSTDIVLDSAENIYTTGIFWDMTDFDPGPDTFMLSPSGFWDAFVCKLDSGGNLLWAGAMGGVGDDYAKSIALGPDNSIYTAGYFKDAADFDPGTGSYLMTPAGYGGFADAFVQKMHQWLLGEPGFNLAGKAMQLFPNPTRNVVNIAFNLPGTDAALVIYNIMGQPVYRRAILPERHTLQIRSLSPGLYLCTLSAGGKVSETQKLLIVR